MTEPLANSRYRVAVKQAPVIKRWLRSLGVILANLTSWFDGGPGPSNPGGRRVIISDASSGNVVLELVEEFGDDTGLVSNVVRDVESLPIADFEAEWL